MKIQVTREHIESGMKCSREGCPIALAIKDVVKGFVAVDVKEITISFYWDIIRFSIDDKLINFIDNFDEGKKVRPRVIDLDIPKKYLKKVRSK